MIPTSRFKNLAIVLALICSLFSFVTTPAQAATREVVCGTGTYTITDGVASAGSDCTGALVFENDVTEIAREGFRNSAITSLTLPSNLQTIRYAAFYETTQYPSLVIPNSVTLIENQAFEQGQFTSLTLGNGLTSIGDQVFYRNYGIRINSITFGTGLTSIGYAAFQNFGVDRLTIPEGVTTISGRAFDAISSSVLVLPNSLTTLASDSFVGGNFSIVKYCGSNAAVTSYTFNIPKTCGAIIDFDPNLGSGSMNPQTSTTNTTLRSSTFTRSGYVFQGWNTQSNGLGSTYLTSDSFPFSSSPDKTLYAKWLPICDGSIPCSIGDTGPGGGVIFYVSTSLFDCGPTLSDKCKYLEYARTTGTNPWSRVSAAWSGETLTAIATTSAAIGSGYKNTLAMVNQPGGGNTAGRAGTLTRAYGGPNNLSDWYLPSIDELDALRLYDVNHTNELNQVDNFEYWSSTEVDFRIANLLVFLNGSVDIALKSSNIAVQPIRAFGSSNFINCGTSGTYRVENNVVTGNSNCTGSVTIPSGITSIANSAFVGNTQITSVTIPNTVVTIGLEAFKNTTSMTTITFEEGSILESINGGAFEGSAISSIRIPDSVNNLGLFLFYRASSLTSVTLPAGISFIGESMFESATSLTSVTFPASVTTIGRHIFKNATSLSSFTIPTGVTTLDLNAFENTPALTTYIYCGTLLTDTQLNNAGLTGKRRDSCTQPVVYVAPTPEITALPPSFLRVKISPTISITADSYTCDAGSLIFWRYGVTQEPAKLTYQKISLLSNGKSVTSFETLNLSVSFEKSSTWTGSTMTCQIYAIQEHAAGTFSSLGSEKYDEAARAQGGAIKAADLKHSSDRKAAYEKRAAGLLRISDARRQELSQAKTSAQTRAAEAKYRAGLLQTLVALNKEFEIAKQERARAKADAAKAFTQELYNLGVAIIQP